MTKKHFIALAAALAQERPTPMGGDEEAFWEEAVGTWARTRNAIADVCARFNPNFDRDRFVAATEV